MTTATKPTRSLTDQRKPHRYTPSHRTDVAATIAKFQRLQTMQAAWGRSENNPANYPDDSDCNQVDAAGTFKG